MTKEEIKNELKKIVAGALREFGYPDCNEKNIMEIMIFKMFFKKHLKDIPESNNSIFNDSVNELIKELEK